METVLPGSAHPNGPLSAQALADRLGVELARIEQWTQEGLPCHQGLYDLFAAVNWITWQRLGEVPSLHRRWQSFIAHFFPLTRGQDAPRQVRWHRRQVLYLPGPVRLLRWIIPSPLTEVSQEVLHEDAPQGEGTVASGLLQVAAWRHIAGHWRLDQQQAPAQLSFRQTIDLALSPQRILPWDDGEHSSLFQLLSPLVSEFHYGYRQHEVDDTLLGARSRYPQGSCLDCAFLAQGILQDAGWETRLCGGVIAHSVIANPHFWLEVHTSYGWAPCDPSLAAVARMLGLPWEPWLAAAIGAHDTKRILLARGPAALPGLPAFTYCSGATGSAAVAGSDGVWKQAWACLDWACGECSDTFQSLEAEQPPAPEA